MTWPATTAPARCVVVGRGAQPKCAAAGPTITEASVTRPVTTTSAPASRQSAMPQRAEVGVGGQRRCPARARRRGRAGRRPRRGRPGPSSPSRSARSRTASARPAGFSPPALATMRTPRSWRQAEAVLELAQERLGVAAVGVLHPVAAEDQHGQLGQVVAGEQVEFAAGRASRASPRAGRRRSPSSSRSEPLTVTRAPSPSPPNQPVG